MPGAASRMRSRQAGVIWPGFVDALATLLMVIIFLLMIFVVAQFFLGKALSGRDESLERLNSQVAELGSLLALERKASADLGRNVEHLSEELQVSIKSRDNLAATVDDLTRRATSAEDRAAKVEALEALKEDLERQITKTEGRLLKEQEISESVRAQIALLNKQMRALNNQIATLNGVLEAAEKKAEKQKVQIKSLGKRLNAALASKVQQLAMYRSEFFGKLREVLGKTQDVRIVGDRFIFQSEVLFSSGSAELGKPGQVQLNRLAKTLTGISDKIPPEIDWVLRVDGHTDRVPIKNRRYPSNWELSAARAISVVKHLIRKGISAKRLVAAGFGEQHPLDARTDKIALRRNRRIEFKLTQR